MEKENNYTIAEEFELPSKGEIYDKPVNAHVKLRSMVMRDEMRRTAKTNTPNTLLADIIEDCMIEKPSVHVADMHYGDYEYLLHKLRTVTHSEIYTMTCICPFCGQVQDVSVNLDEEEIKDFNVEEFNALTTLKLPKSGKEVKLKYSTPRLIDSIKIKAEELRKNAKDTSLDYDRLAAIEEAIDLVDGVKLSYVQKENFINNLPAGDINKIEKRIDEIKGYIGLKEEVKFTCNNSKCGEEVLTFFRYTSEFFKPTND